MKIKTEKLYHNFFSADPFEAEILELRQIKDGKTAVLLDKTIFYPEGGGQPADRGTINGVPVADVLEKDGEILHLMKDSGDLKPGRAELVLDCRRRRDLTQLHTGQHLLSAILLRLANAPTVSMHLGDESSTIDVDIPEMDDELILQIEDAVSDAIEGNHPVIVHLCPPEDLFSFPLRRVPPQGEEVIRIVEIKDYDFVACCGTHLNSTAEVGLFRILTAEKYKGMTRINFLAGRRLLLDSRLLRQNAVTVSRALSVPVNKIGEGVLEFIEKANQNEKQLKAFKEKAVQEKAEILVKKAASAAEAGVSCPVIIAESYAEEDINDVQNIGKAAQKHCQAVLVLASEQSLKFAAFSSVKDLDLRQFLKEAFEAQGGKGGGGASFFQGSFSTKEALDAFLRKLAHTV